MNCEPAMFVHVSCVAWHASFGKLILHAQPVMFHFHSVMTHVKEILSTRADVVWVLHLRCKKASQPCSGVCLRAKPAVREALIYRLAQ